MREITDRQQEILNLIIETTLEEQRILTIRDLSELLNISVKAVQDNIVALRKKGKIGPAENKRGIYPIGIKIVRIESES